MKDVLLPLSEITLVSAAVSRFGIKLNILQSDTDSDSSYPNPEFIVATSINREDLGTTLRTGDKLVLVNGRPTYEMWNQRVDGVLRLSFDEKRKKRRPKTETLIPKVICAITKIGETQENIFIRPECERAHKLLKSSGAIATIGNVMAKMDLMEKDKVSNNSSSASVNDDEPSPVVASVQFKDQLLFCCTTMRQRHLFYIWVSSQHYTKDDCVSLVTQITAFLDFLYGTNIIGSDHRLLNDLIDQMNLDPKSNMEFTAPGTVILNQSFIGK